MTPDRFAKGMTFDIAEILSALHERLVTSTRS